MIEDFNDLSLDAASPSYWDKRVNHENSSLVEITVDANTTVGDIPLASGGPLENGANGDAPGVVHFQGDHLEVDKRTGLAALALDKYRDIAIVAAPGQTSPTCCRRVITHCELNRFRIAVVDSEQNKPTPTPARPEHRHRRHQVRGALLSLGGRQRSAHRRSRSKCRRAALCAVSMPSPTTTRGVWKAPANEPSLAR
jgi:hypothetical protein